LDILAFPKKKEKKKKEDLAVGIDLRAKEGCRLHYQAHHLEQKTKNESRLK